MKRSESCITTKRLWLRQIDETDAESIVMLRSDEKVYRYFLNPIKITVEDHRKWFDEKYCLNDYRIDWIAVDDDKGILVGVYGAKKNESDEVEISYLTADQMRGRGFASEAVEAIIDWCMKNWNTSVFFVTVHKDNAASIEFAINNGFELEDDDASFLRLRKEVLE